MLNSEISELFHFVLIKNVKVKVPGGIEQFIGLQGNGIYIFQKSAESFRITIWGPTDRWQDRFFLNFLILILLIETSHFLC